MAFRYATAKEWGMTWKRPAVPEKLADPEAYVHHSAGGRLSLDAFTAFRMLNRMAQDSKDYSALDYDILVHRNVSTGLITIGGGREEWMSAATLDRNEAGEAICLLGYFHPHHSLSEYPTDDEIEGIARAIVWGMEKGWIGKTAKILGHRDNPAHLNATACCGDYLYGELPTVRGIVDRILNIKPVPVPTPKPLPTPATYVVQSGDGWYAIARKLTIGVDSLLALNGAKFDTMLHPGDILKVPSLSTPEAPIHPPGETLSTPPGTPAMRLGDTDASTRLADATGGRVTWLQLVIGVRPTGIYDTATVTKILELQELGGIFEDGVYGEQTAQLFLLWRKK